jgi:hypothetical protein
MQTLFSTELECRLFCRRDSLHDPAEMLRLAGTKPGMRAADVLAGDGYYSELLSYVVGPDGIALLIKVYHDLFWVDPEGHWPSTELQGSHAWKNGSICAAVP